MYRPTTLKHPVATAAGLAIALLAIPMYLRIFQVFAGDNRSNGQVLGRELGLWLCVAVLLWIGGGIIAAFVLGGIFTAFYMKYRDLVANITGTSLPILLLTSSCRSSAAAVSPHAHGALGTSSLVGATALCLSVGTDFVTRAVLPATAATR